mmetsp:Transcript_82966/g.138499  ORF Transcript_82966/g.138499 Transcript_82966/m.138499 type:complete len:81 (+) Transcript_82966:348-590(+)
MCCTNNINEGRNRLASVEDPFEGGEQVGLSAAPLWATDGVPGADANPHPNNTKQRCELARIGQGLARPLNMRFRQCAAQH